MVYKNKQLPKVNFFDGQRVSEADLDAEQLHTNTIVSSLAAHFHGSGVVRENPFEDTILFHTLYPSTYGDNEETKTLIESGAFDGKGLKFDRQPSDSEFGNRIEIEASGLAIKGLEFSKILIVGKVFDGSYPSGLLSYEFIEIKKNGKFVTKNLFKQIYGVILNNFSGGEIFSESFGESESLNLKSSGYLIFREASPLSVYNQSLSCSQEVSPNIDYLEFGFETDGQTVIQELIGTGNNFLDFGFEEIGIKETKKLLKNGYISDSFGQKFLSLSNNIQKVELLLSVEEDSSRLAGQEYDFSGELVVSIYDLSTEITGVSSVVPTDAIDFPPSAYPIAEVSFSQADLLSKGVVLNGSPKKISFDFSSTSVANLDSEAEKGKYYCIVVNRRGSNSIGTIQLTKGYDVPKRKKSLGIPLSTLEQFDKQKQRSTLYDSTLNKYIDDFEGCFWFKVYSSTLEVVDGFAYSESGVGISVPKVAQYVGGINIPHRESHLSLKSLSESNYVVLSHIEKFEAPNVHPRSGNLVYTRISDIGTASVYSLEELTEVLSSQTPLLLAKFKDENVRYSETLSGTLSKPGQIHQDYVLILNPTSDLLSRNLVGYIFTPDTECECEAKYIITEVECGIAKTGDLNFDGAISSEDLLSAIALSGEEIGTTSTDKKLLGLDIDLLSFIQSDCDGNNEINGADIDKLENALVGVVDFSYEQTKYLKIYLENINQESNYPTIFTKAGTSTTTITTAATNQIQIVVDDEKQGIVVQPGDVVSISDAISDNGSYEVISRTISGTLLTLLVKDLNGDIPSFVGTFGFDVSIVSGSKINLLADNNALVTTPFASLSFQISTQGSFSEQKNSICDLRRFVSGTYLEAASESCKPVEQDCLSEMECEPKFKNQTYIPNDLYIPSGEILKAPGVPHHGDWEYTTITVPVPPGTIQDCEIDLYNTFIKSYNGTDKTAAGFPAMKFSDGTLVGCEDSGANTDISKGRVKFSHSISSLYVDAYIGAEGGTPTSNEVTFDTFDEIYNAEGDEDYSSSVSTSLLSITVGNSVTYGHEYSWISFQLPISSNAQIDSAYLHFKEASPLLDGTGSINIYPLKDVNIPNLFTKLSNGEITEASYEYTVSASETLANLDTETKFDITDVITYLKNQDGHLEGNYKAIYLKTDDYCTFSTSVYRGSGDNVPYIVINYSEPTTNVIFKVGTSVDPTTGIATFNTKNVLYDSSSQEKRTVVKFGVHLKKAGFANQDVSVSLADIQRIGLGSCTDESSLVPGTECFAVESSTATGLYISGPFPCSSE
jgi:hypothetical protein